MSMHIRTKVLVCFVIGVAGFVDLAVLLVKSLTSISCIVISIELCRRGEIRFYGSVMA